MDERFFVKKQKLALPMGRQFEALDQTNKTTVLVHRFSKGDSGTKDVWREEFQKDAAVLAALDAFSIPRIIDYGVDDKGPFLIMEEPSGVRLSEVVNCGPMQAASVRQMAEQFLQAYSVAAVEGIYHSALNPLLIMVGENEAGNRFQVTDLGFAEVHNKIQGEEGRVLGDPAFLSPCQLQGKEQDESGSLFSLGQLCYYCLAGGHPFGGMALPAILQGHENGQLPNIAQFRSDLPTDFAQWIDKMTAAEPSQRFQSIGEALAALPEVPGLTSIPMDLTGIVNAQPVSATSTQAVVPHNRPKLITGTQAIRPATAQTGAQQTVAPSPVVAGQQPASVGSPAPVVAQPPSGLDVVWGTPKKKIITSCVGGGILLLIIIGLIAASSDDDENAPGTAGKGADGGDSQERVEQKGMDEETKALFSGLAYGWHFDQDLLPINRNTPKIEAYGGIDYVDGLQEKALVLGPDNYYSIPKKSELFIEQYSASTVSVWVKVPGQWERGPMVIGNKKYNLPGSKGWCIAANPNTPMKFRCSIYDGKSTLTADSSLLVTAERWHMFTIVMRSGDPLKFYQDGILVGELEVENTRDLHTGSDIYIGTDGVERAIFGENIAIDQLYIWHRALTDSEVKKLYQDKSVYVR